MNMFQITNATLKEKIILMDFLKFENNEIWCITVKKTIFFFFLYFLNIYLYKMVCNFFFTTFDLIIF